MAIESLLDGVFGADRKSRTAYLLRRGAQVISALSLGLLDDGVLIGSIQCWPVKICEDSGESTPLILVGPVAVAPDRQNQGHGGHLMKLALDGALLEGNPPLIMIGDPEYYGRFGFDAKETGGWQLPGPWQAHRLLLRNVGEYILPLSGMIAADTHN